MLKYTSALALVAGVVASTSAFAVPVYGSLANFDVVNNTGHTAHGFSIEMEGIDKSQIINVFGLNRNFGTASPGDVERYGLPVIGDLLDGFGNTIGASVTYKASFSGGAWDIGTLSGVFNTPGESCWLFGNVNYPDVPCDHFGVSTRGTPTKTTYNWLLDPTNSGTLTGAAVSIPSVQFMPPPPPVAGVPQAPVVAVIQAVQANPALPQDDAYWVKIVQTTLDEIVDINDLIGGDNPFAVAEIADLNNKTETEIEWQVLQPGKVDEVSKAVQLNPADKSLVVRYEFFKYLGRFDDDGFIDPTSAQFPTGDTLNEFVGDYIGMQVAGFNPAQPFAFVPEPASLTLFGVSLLGLGALRRGKSKA